MSHDRGINLRDLCADLRDRSHIRIRCAHCDWQAEGAFADVRHQFTEHRRRDHPTAKTKEKTAA